MKRGGGPRGPPRKSSSQDREHQNGSKSQLERIKTMGQKLKKFLENSNETAKDRDNGQQSRLIGTEMRLDNIERMMEDLPERGHKSKERVKETASCPMPQRITAEVTPRDAAGSMRRNRSEKQTQKKESSVYPTEYSTHQ